MRKQISPGLGNDGPAQKVGIFQKWICFLVTGTSVGALLRERGTGAFSRPRESSGQGAITQMRRTYRLARAAGYSPLQAFVAMFSDVDRKFLNLTEAEFNAWRDKVVESEPELAKQGSEAAGSPE